MRNILVREVGSADAVIVRCVECQQLVARYELSGYYHHGKGFESWMASYRGAQESGRYLTERFASDQRAALEQFERVARQLDEEGKD